MYHVRYYGPDGHGTSGRTEEFRSLDEAREAVRRKLGVKALRGSRRWSGSDDDVEAYHEYPPSHPRADGCGGYVIATVER